jgi:hypothetical protein
MRHVCRGCSTTRIPGWSAAGRLARDNQELKQFVGEKA